MLADGRPAGPLVASTMLEKERANTMTMREKLKVHREIVEGNKRKLKAWKEGLAVTFRRVYMIGGENGKADPSDYVVGYKASNGKYIEIMELIDNSFRWYVVDGVSFDTLKQAKAAC